MFELIEDRIVKNTRMVLKEAEKEGLSPRDAALKIAQGRVKQAMEKRKREILTA